MVSSLPRTLRLAFGSALLLGCTALSTALFTPAAAQPLAIGGSAGSAAASAQQNPTPGQADGGATPSGPAPGEPGFTTGLFSGSRSNLLGDLYGIRTKLGQYGISLGLSETSEVFGNATGGIHQGAAYDGLTLMGLGVDTQKAFGWEGGTFNVSALQIHGRSLSADNLQTLQTASGIEAERATRLWELWYQQAFLDGRFDVKIGQQSIDQEFMISGYSSLFINTMMGWPLIPSVDLYAGGPAYPLSSLGVRLRGQPMDDVTVLGGVFDDNPPGGPFSDDDQLRRAEKSGTEFNVTTGALIMGEIQYAVNQPNLGQMDRGNSQPGLPGVYKLGFWYDTANFPDQRFGDDGLSLADSSSSGNARLHRGNWSVYGVFDQMVWRPDEQSPRSVGIFARIMGAPGNQNLANFSVNTGVVLKAPLPGRDDDSFGIGYGLAKLSGRVSQLDQDAAAQNGGIGPVRSSESFIELTYQAQIAPWWQVQPDFQYVFTPAGGVADVYNPAKRLGNEAVFGVRTNITF